MTGCETQSPVVNRQGVSAIYFNRLVTTCWKQAVRARTAFFNSHCCPA